MFGWWVLLAWMFVGLLDEFNAFKTRTPLMYMRGLLFALLLIWLIFFRP